MGYVPTLLERQLHPMEGNVPLSEFWLPRASNCQPISLPQDCLEVRAQENGIKGGKNERFPTPDL